MANDLDDELYPDNDDIIRVVPTREQVNATTGAFETVPLTGLTNLKAYLATTADVASDAAAINAGLVITLAEAGSTGIYYGTLTGAAKRSYLGATADGTTIYEHWQSGTIYHESHAVIWRTKRPAAAA